MLEYLVNLDKHLFILINSHWTAPWADSFFPFITDLHKTIQFKVIMIPLLLALFIWRRGLKKGIMIFLFAVAALGISDGFSNYAIKKTVQRPRPADTMMDPQFQSQVQVRAPFGGYSFVSNHAVNIFCIVTFLSIIFPVSRFGLYILAIAVGYSRVYNGVHFPLDVLGGACVGIFFGILMAKAYTKVVQLDEQRAKVTT